MKVKEGQSIYDVCLEQFGSLDYLYNLIVDNGLNASRLMIPGQELTVNNSGVGLSEVKNFFKVNKLSPSNDQTNGNPPQEAGDYNNDFSNDFR